MRTTTALAAGILLAAPTALLVPPAYAAQGDLAGTWTSVDTDGSNQTLRISGTGNPTYAMFLTDDATSGGCGGPPAQLVGTGRVDGDDVLMRGTLVCLPGGNPVPGGHFFFNFEHDDAADTLTDSTGVVWHRLG